MANLESYRNFIKQLLSQYTAYDKVEQNFEIQLVFDESRDHYIWFHVGWEGSKRIYYSVIHFDIKDSKIWLQQNLTELDPAQDLVDLGVPRDDIILGLQPPFKRPYTDYGVA